MGIDGNELAKLQAILAKVYLLKSGEDRSTILEILGLRKLCPYLNCHDSPRPFFINLYASLRDKPVWRGAEENSALASLLEYLLNSEQEELIDEEKRFLEEFIKKSQQNIRQRRQNRTVDRPGINSMWDQARGEPGLSVTPAKPVKLDIHKIIQFNLKEFSQALDSYRRYKGVLAFAMDGSDTVLEKYLLERLMWELTCDLPGPYGFTHRKIFLSMSQATSGAKFIEDQLTKFQDCQRLTELFADYHTDLVVSIWNNNIPPDQMLSISTAFCQKVRDEVAPVLQGKLCRLILIWLNVGKGGGEHYCYLSLPPFDTGELTDWFGRWLQYLGVAPADQARYLDRLTSTQGDLVSTYKTIDDIIEELQGGLH